ncbi:hypothetical protein [Streptomyces sp. NPDC000851]
MVAAPVLGLVFALRGPRAFLDEDLVVEDLPSTLRAEMLADDPVERAMTGRRDQRLNGVFAEPSAGPQGKRGTEVVDDPASRGL